MSMLKSFIIVSTLVLCSMHTNGYGFSIGPFNFGGDGGSGGYVQERGPYSQIRDMQNRNVLSQSLCYAISQQKQVEVVIKQLDKVNAKEMKITTKKIIIDPYVFGMNNDQQLVVRGHVADEKVLKEVTVKFSDEEKADQPQKAVAVEPVDQQQKDETKAPVIPAKGETGEINILQIKNIRVMEDSHFDAPKDFDKIFKDTMSQVFCHINPPAVK